MLYSYFLFVAYIIGDSHGLLDCYAQYQQLFYEKIQSAIPQFTLVFKIYRSKKWGVSHCFSLYSPVITEVTSFQLRSAVTPRYCISNPRMQCT